MDFNLRTPCPHCPFRKDVRPYLTPARALDIITKLDEKTFECHETAHGPKRRDKRGRFTGRDNQHCAGALIIMIKQGRSGQLQQVAERLGLYDPSRLNTEAPTYNTFQEMLRAYFLNEGCLDCLPTNPPWLAQVSTSADEEQAPDGEERTHHPAHLSKVRSHRAKG